MGLSSIGITFLFLGVSARPKNFERTSELEMKRLQAASEMSLVVDSAAAAAAAEAKTKNLVQSMALSCPPPVVSFLRFDSTSTIE